MKKLLTVTLSILALVVQTFAQAGLIDSTFNPGTGADIEVHCTAIQSDGKIIIGGEFSSYNGVPRNEIARLNSDGSLDESFNPGTGGNHFIWTTSIQNDGQILIGGGFSIYNGTAINRIARLNTNGTLDTSFNVGAGASNYVRTISIQSDEKIIIAGEFDAYNGITRMKIARLNIDGTLDNTFNPGTGANFYIIGSTIQNDGKIIICGAFTSYNGTAINRIARLNSDGTLDNTFNIGTGANDEVRTISIQSDGKIIIGGHFTSFNGIVANRITRLNPDGTLDPTFNIGTGADSLGLGPLVWTSSILSDGKILIGGFFTVYNGIVRNSIARLNSDGTLDSFFNPGTGVSGVVESISVQSNGGIIIGGSFISYNGTARNNVARVQNNVISGTNNLNLKDNSIKIFPNPTNGELTLQADDFSGTVVSVYNNMGHLIIQQKNICTNVLRLDLSKQAQGMYIVEVNLPSNSNRFKVLKQ
jgi:uncharacterized delta-60 repeat protein